MDKVIKWLLLWNENKGKHFLALLYIVYKNCYEDLLQTNTKLFRLCKMELDLVIYRMVSVLKTHFWLKTALVSWEASSCWTPATLSKKRLRPATLSKKRLRHRCFPVNFGKILLRKPFWENTSTWLLLNFTRCVYAWKSSPSATRNKVS